MPTYEYACTKCSEHLEVVQSFKDEPLTVCPGCQGQLRKVFSPIGIAFKGSGFYKTDSRSTGVSPAAKKETKETSSAESSGTSASSSTPDSSGTSSSGSTSPASAPSSGSATAAAAS